MQRDGNVPYKQHAPLIHPQSLPFDYDLFATRSEALVSFFFLSLILFLANMAQTLCDGLLESK